MLDALIDGFQALSPLKNATLAAVLPARSDPPLIDLILCRSALMRTIQELMCTDLAHWTDLFLLGHLLKLEVLCSHNKTRPYRLAFSAGWWTVLLKLCLSIRILMVTVRAKNSICFFCTSTHLLSREQEMRPLVSLLCTLQFYLDGFPCRRILFLNILRLRVS